MAEQLTERKYERQKKVLTTISIALGIMVLLYSASIFILGVGLETTIRYSNGDMYGYAPSELTSLLRLIAYPAILIGLGFLLIGLVNRTKKHPPLRLRQTITILGLSLICFATMVGLFMISAVVIGSALFP